MDNDNDNFVIGSSGSIILQFILQTLQSGLYETIYGFNE